MDAKTYEGFFSHALDDRHTFLVGRLPEQLLMETQFNELWNLHPQEYHEIMMHGRLVKTPRWQQAHGRDYHYTGRVNSALPMPDLLKRFLAWATAAIDDRLNGTLVNYYEGLLDHYIGKHRDSTKHMIVGAPIVTISLGDERNFRLRPWKQPGIRDFRATNGTVFIMPYETNLAWTHEVPASAKHRGRRISITFRAFEVNSQHPVTARTTEELTAP